MHWPTATGIASGLRWQASRRARRPGHPPGLSGPQRLPVRLVNPRAEGRAKQCADPVAHPASGLVGELGNFTISQDGDRRPVAVGLDPELNGRDGRIHPGLEEHSVRSPGSGHRRPGLARPERQPLRAVIRDRFEQDPWRRGVPPAPGGDNVLCRSRPWAIVFHGNTPYGLISWHRAGGERPGLRPYPRPLRAGTGKLLGRAAANAGTAPPSARPAAAAVAVKATATIRLVTRNGDPLVRGTAGGQGRRQRQAWQPPRVVISCLSARRAIRSRPRPPAGRGSPASARSCGR